MTSSAIIPAIETSPIGSRDRECASLDFLRLRAATFEFELEREKQHRSETGRSMPQEWVASLQHGREEILDQIQRRESQVRVDTFAPSGARTNLVQTCDPVIHTPVPSSLLSAAASNSALGSDDRGRNSFPARVHGSSHTHRRSATAHQLSNAQTFPQASYYHISNLSAALDVTDDTQSSFRNRKREVQERDELEDPSRKHLNETSVPKQSCSPQIPPRPFLVPKSQDDTVVGDSPAERKPMNATRRHHGMSSPLSPYRPATPTPLSPPNLFQNPLGISDSGRRSARGWYSTTTRPDKENLHRFLLSPSRSDLSRTPKSKVTVLDDNDQPVFTEDDDLYTHEASSMEWTPTIGTTTFNAHGRRTDASDINGYARPASAAAVVCQRSPFETRRSTTTPLQIAMICRTLMNIFRDLTKYKQFLSYRDRAAQSLLNFLQSLLDYSQLEEGFRGILFVALVRLARKSNLYPECFALTDVTRKGEDPVADGRYGDIYKAHLRGKLVCLKVVRMYEKSDHASLTKAFFREAVLWGQLSHINVLPFHGITRLGDTRQRIGLVSPWMEHGNINEFLVKNPDADRRLLVMDVAAGMSHLHSHRVTHGDLKGSNILVTESKRACLADFGFSSVMDSQGLKTASLSSATPEGGTVRFQAPELINPQYEGVRSPASDVYAFALVCYEIFTETVPFCDISNSYTVMYRVAHGDRPARPPGSLYTDRGLNDAMWKFMEDCWEHIPAKRPTASQIIHRLPRVPDNRPRLPWSRLRASASCGLANAPGLAIVETLRVLETIGV